MLLAQIKSTWIDGSAVIEPTTASLERSDRTLDAQISRLVGEVYECAPEAEQGRLLEHLLNPLGAVARVTVAHGVFAECLFRSGWRESQIRLVDAPIVRIEDIINLVDYVQKVSVESVDALADMMKTWPVIACSVSLGLLMTELIQRAKLNRSGGYGDDDGES